MNTNQTPARSMAKESFKRLFNACGVEICSRRTHDASPKLEGLRDSKERGVLAFFKDLVRLLFNAFGLEIRGCRTSKTERLLSTLDPQFGSVLLSMYWGEPQLGADSQRHPIDSTAICPARGMWLYNFCLAIKPKSTLEIGMAYGYSTIFFLAAMARNRIGRHTAIDPFQCSYWHGIGLVHARALAPATNLDLAFRLIEDRSDRVASDLARSDSAFDLIFIDGNHRFDDVLVDFYLYAPLCALGGHVVFDDLLMPSIRTVVAFVRANRSDFVELRIPEPNLAVFRKVSVDSRQWNDFHKFAG